MRIRERQRCVQRGGDSKYLPQRSGRVEGGREGEGDREREMVREREDI